MSELIKMFMDDDGNEVPEEKATRLNIVTSIVFVRTKTARYGLTAPKTSMAEDGRQVFVGRLKMTNTSI